MTEWSNTKKYSPPSNNNKKAKSLLDEIYIFFHVFFFQVKKWVPDLQIEYSPDSRQVIADSWPMVFDDSLARYSPLTCIDTLGFIKTQQFEIH